MNELSREKSLERSLIEALSLSSRTSLEASFAIRTFKLSGWTKLVYEIEKRRNSLQVRESSAGITSLLEFTIYHNKLIYSNL